MDKIIINGLKLFAYHGVNPEEKENGQIFIIDLEALTSLERAGETDCLDDTVSYAKIIKTVRRVFCEKKYDLIERAARVTADAVLEEYPAIEKIKIIVKKPDAPISADFGYVAVEIERTRQ